jgi:UDP-glucose 6-dehydrogenase
MGIDCSQAKVNLINQLHIIEPEADEIIASSVQTARLCAAEDFGQTIQDNGLWFVGVGTRAAPFSARATNLPPSKVYRGRP